MIYKEYSKNMRPTMRFLVKNIQSVRNFEDMIKKLGFSKAEGFFMLSHKHDSFRVLFRLKQFPPMIILYKFLMKTMKLNVFEVLVAAWTLMRKKEQKAEKDVKP